MKKRFSGFHSFKLSLSFRVEEGQEPVNLTGGPLAYKYQFQEMFFHWGQKVVIMMFVVIVIMMLFMSKVVRRIKQK